VEQGVGKYQIAQWRENFREEELLRGEWEKLPRIWLPATPFLKEVGMV
jgi:hypothetical protein